METIKHYLISLLLSFVAMLISMMMGLGDFMVGFFYSISISSFTLLFKGQKHSRLNSYIQSY
jgi:hypothetical protein